ncbi:hypothetical protein [Haladaptatus sp. R4]|uniref:hypothetical protein n=1 Tax=Haladaptatus sp. R4 TaxID=1679489 RepID=UPI0012372710|nr:hypothetical protein [Haladaptatus sp. R4]
MAEFDPTLGQENNKEDVSKLESLLDFEETTDPYLKRIKDPGTPKQKECVPVLEEHATIDESGEVDVTPALTHLRDKHGQSYTQKGYLHQMLGQFLVVVDEKRDTEDIAKRVLTAYQLGVKDAAQT